MHFLYFHINSLLPKTGELKCIANKTKATTIIGITESKLDHTVPDLEANLPVNDILWCDKDRNGGHVACYIKKDLYLIQDLWIVKKLRILFFIYFCQSWNQLL